MSASTRLAVLFAVCLVLNLGRASVALAQSPGQFFGGHQPEGSDPSDTRLVLMPTARTLPAGASSLTFLDVIFPLVQFGVTDRLSVGAGTLAPIPVPQHPIIVLAKLQLYDHDTTRAAAGVINAAGLGAGSIGFAYGVVTRGTDDDAWTAGGGWMYARADGHGGGIPVAFFGGEHRISARQKTIVDVLVRKNSAVANVGIRIIRDSFATDVAAMVMVFDGTPLTGATISFGWRF